MIIVPTVSIFAFFPYICRRLLNQKNNEKTTTIIAHATGIADRDAGR
jgi:hypothetical protein